MQFVMCHFGNPFLADAAAVLEKNPNMAADISGWLCGYEQLDDYFSGTSGLGRVISREESATDVTESYYDTQARLETQQALMARLQALVTDAADLSDLLTLESQIAETQYQIDRLQSSLNSTDR